jgi:light-regulated signal transduction histidine kinase (bacteriophytochrome)
LEAANRELETFSYSVSHDLRAPLRIVDGFSVALLEDFAEKLGPQGQEMVVRIRTAGQRMGHLIDDLMNLARINRVELMRQRVDLSRKAREIVAELRSGDDRRNVEITIDDGLGADADPRLLRIVLTNLLSNAWKFTGRRERTLIHFGLKIDKGTEVFFVRDNGAGFDMAYAARLFQAFQRLHGHLEFPGTGIGLATVQRIVHRHGGRIWVEAELDKGATFYFTLQPPLLRSAL